MADLPTTQACRIPAAVHSFFAEAWLPEPLPAPCVIKDLSRLGFLERASAALTYQVLRLEYALSPAGHLRAWVLLSIKTGLVLAIPAVLIVPLVTWLLTGLATWAALLAAIALNMLLALVYVVLIAAILSAIVGVARSKAGHRQ